MEQHVAEPTKPDIFLLQKLAHDREFKALLNKATKPAKKLIKNLTYKSFLLHPIRGAFHCPCRLAGHKHGVVCGEVSVADDDGPKYIAASLTSAVIVAIILAIAFFDHNYITGGTLSWTIFLMLFSYLSLVLGSWELHSVTWDKHKEGFATIRRAQPTTCLNEFLTAFIQQQQNKLLGKGGIFSQLEHLLKIQMKAYGDEQAKLPEPIPVYSYRESAAPDETVEPLPSNLSPELIDTRDRLSRYFAEREKVLLTLCDEQLPKIAELQAEGKTEPVAAKGAEHLEKVFAIRVNQLLTEVEWTTEYALKELTPFFRGDTHDKLTYDLQVSLQAAANINQRMIKTGSVLFNDQRRVNLSPEEQADDSGPHDRAPGFMEEKNI